MTSRTTSVDVVGDAVHEIDEQFGVDLSSANHATITDGHATVTIEDDDDAPVLAIEDVERLEGDSGTTTFGFSITLTGPTEVDALVDFATVAGTATSPSDYTAATGTITIRAGDSTSSVDVQVVGDSGVEPDETFRVVLSDPQDATIGDGSGTATILNDDVSADVQLAVTDSPDPVRVGSELSYHVTVTNGGPSPATGGDAPGGARGRAGLRVRDRQRTEPACIPTPSSASSTISVPATRLR